jgi:hypothetical protein
MKGVWILFAIFALGISALAADVTGTWKGTIDTPNGTIERTFLFKVDGSKLTGETSSEMMGKSPITDGKVDGDTITFTISVKFEDNEMQLNYTGKVSGDEIKFHVEGVGGGPSIDYVAKRVS